MSRAVSLRPWDLRLFAALAECGFLTTPLIAEGLDRSVNSTHRRLLQLAEAGYVAGDKRGVTEATIWHPQQRAVTAAVEAGYLSPEDAAWTWRQSRTTIAHKAHQADVNRLWFALHKHAPADVSVVRCWSGKRLEDTFTAADGHRYTVAPDRFLELAVPKGRFFYCIEVDRHTRSNPSVVAQLTAYEPYAALDRFSQRYGRDGDRHLPFRILVAVPRPVRLYNVVEAVLADGQARGLAPSPVRAYALFDDFAAAPYEPVWVREVELAPIFAWLDSLPVDAPLRSVLPEQQYRPLFAALGDAWLDRCYWRSPQRAKHAQRVRDEQLRDALLSALIAAGYVERFSILDPAWPATPRRRRRDSPTT